MILRMVIPHAQHMFVLSLQLHGICEIRHEILLATGYVFYKSGEGLVLDFGGPSDSFYCLFSVGSFLTLLFDIRNVAILEGGHDAQPSLDPLLLIMKNEV